MISGFKVGLPLPTRHSMPFRFTIFLYSDNSADSFELQGAEIGYVEDGMIRHGELASRGPVCRLSYLLLYSDNLTTRQED
jgi:hypothetical protein